MTSKLSTTHALESIIESVGVRCLTSLYMDVRSAGVEVRPLTRRGAYAGMQALYDLCTLSLYFTHFTHLIHLVGKYISSVGGMMNNSISSPNVNTALAISLANQEGGI